MGYKTWPPRFLLKGGIRSPHGSFGTGKGGSGVPESAGAELTTNGTFAADVSWTKDAGWAIAAGVATATASGAAAFIHQAVAVSVNQMYKLVYTVTAYTSGDIRWSFDNGQVGATYAATGTYTDYFVITSAATEIQFGRASSDFTGSIDNVSLKKIG